MIPEDPCYDEVCASIEAGNKASRDRAIDEQRRTKADEARISCDHVWEPVGYEEVTPTLIRVVYACSLCSSFTYHEMKFVGWKMESLDDRLAEVAEKAEGRSG